jgi:ParB family chromosome partitioning protein
LLIGLKIHPAFPGLATEPEAQASYTAVEAQARLFAAGLGFAVAEDESVWSHLPRRGADALSLYEAVRRLSDAELAALQTLLTILSFGQADCDRLDTSDSLFNRVARDAGADMKRQWCPDTSFLSKRTRDQLVGIARDCGYADGNGVVGSYKKAELVTCLARFFGESRQAGDPTPVQRKGRDWLPEVMLFPAVDPCGVLGDAPEPEADDTDNA